MADVELVIKIPEEMAYRFKHEGEQKHYDYHTVIKACINGITLPKGHGRLIDADRLKEEFKEHHDFYVNAYGEFKNLPINDKSRVDEITNSIASVVNSPTIIAADKENGANV